MPEPITMTGVGGGTIGFAIHLARRHFDAAKEVVDIALGFIALVLWLPLLIVCAAIIKASNRGPIFFTQMRAGRNGRLFRMYKLRTMVVAAESESGPKWAEEDDPRIIPACRWMRRTHVDELPQLINVIKGDMSLVGPRPERPEILAELEGIYPRVRSRLDVRPGITGLAQIRNGYDTTREAFRGKLDADLEYIDRRRWSLDLSIMWATLARFFGDSRAR
jgi:lipopolysaccharide/colanic/teichoic acid biosynthesis glycosyltransferase